MIQRRIFLAVLVSALGSVGIVDSLYAFQKSENNSKLKLIFEDDFERNESDEEKEELGNGWSTNSSKRAGGNKQVDLREGTMHIYMHKAADHAVSVRHDAQFQNGEVHLRFMLENEKDIEPDRTIEFASDEYQELVWELVSQRRHAELALDGDILISVDGKTILIKGAPHDKPVKPVNR